MPRISLHRLDFAHVPVMYGGNVTIVPCDRDCVPVRFRDDAVVTSITSPTHASAFLELLRFGGGQGAFPFELSTSSRTTGPG
jgi:hypothetical protein